MLRTHTGMPLAYPDNYILKFKTGTHQATLTNLRGSLQWVSGTANRDAQALVQESRNSEANESTRWVEFLLKQLWER